MSTHLVLHSIPFFILSLFQIKRSRWIGLVPSKALQYRLKKKLGFSADKAMVFNFRDLVEMGEARMNELYYSPTKDILYFGRELEQIVAPSDLWDQKLIKKSWPKLFPHEVLQVQLRGTSGDLYVGKIFHGKMFSVGSKEKIKKEIYNILGRIRKTGDRAIEVIIAHTHPGVDCYLQKNGRSHYLLQGLSEADIEIAKSLKEFLDIEVTVKAVTINGISYKRTIK